MINYRALTAQSIALAGLFQSLEQVQHCARSGATSNPDAMRAVLESVMRIDAADTESVYGNLSSLRPGLSLLAQHLARKMNAAHHEQTRYAASLMSVERRLVRSPTAAAQLTDMLREIASSRGEHAIDSQWMVQQLASAYSKHVSTLLPRVMISGEPIYLKTPENAERIRALLLAGLRATVLWRQCGGTQLKLLLLRKAMQRSTHELLQS
jgi:high frequency lysogenization protein